MRLNNVYKDFWSKAFDFKGRTSRLDWWLSWLGIWLGFLLLGLVLVASIFLANGPIDEGYLPFMQKIVYVFAYLHFLPYTSLLVRRLRDTGRRWPWILTAFVPWISYLTFIWLCVMPSKEIRLK